MTNRCTVPLFAHRDTVNLASRHESTGEAGRVHTSQATMLELLENADQFFLTERGLGKFRHSVVEQQAQPRSIFLILNIICICS